MSEKLVWPDYSNCIANLPNSVLKYFKAETAGNTLPLMDKYLGKEYKNVVVFLLDGMGKAILERHLSKDGAFRSHVVGIYSSTFLSTTVAATTSIISGLQPCEHSWLGWDCYYPQIDKNVTVFSNTVQGSEEQAADYNVAETYTPFTSVFERLGKAGIKTHWLAKFREPHPETIEEMCGLVKNLCGEPGRKYIYAYWNQPDGLLHRNGCGSSIVTEDLENMEKAISNLCEDLEDTLVVITPDHGHHDTEFVELLDYPKITECLIRNPSLEPRVLNFFVKEGMEDTFEKEFTKEFGDRFLLMPMEEAIEKNLFGTGKHHENFRSMLGNYLAIATGNLSIYFAFGEMYPRWAAMHGSVTEDEMLIPLIVFDTKKGDK